MHEACRGSSKQNRLHARQEMAAYFRAFEICFEKRDEEVRRVQSICAPLCLRRMVRAERTAWLHRTAVSRNEG